MLQSLEETAAQIEQLIKSTDWSYNSPAELIKLIELRSTLVHFLEKFNAIHLQRNVTKVTTAIEK